MPISKPHFLRKFVNEYVVTELKLGLRKEEQILKKGC